MKRILLRTTLWMQPDSPVFSTTVWTGVVLLSRPALQVPFCAVSGQVGFESVLSCGTLFGFKHALFFFAHGLQLLRLVKRRQILDKLVQIAVKNLFQLK